LKKIQKTKTSGADRTRFGMNGPGNRP